MKSTRNILFALLLLGGTAAAAAASTAVSAGIHIGPSGHASVDLGFFYDDLAPYGNWIERPSYGWVWTPTAVSTSWQPYEDGHWVWTDEGWVWVSDEPFGWATYHYGRWYDDPEIGWAWVPGYDWSPAWVSWQEGGDYVGWAPLPPGVNLSVSYGSGYGGYPYGIAPAHYVFVPERYFLSRNVRRYALSGSRALPIFQRTRNWTRYRHSGGGYYANLGVPVDHIQRFAGRVPRYQVANLGVRNAGYRHRGARVAGNQVEVFRPQVRKARHIAPPISRPAARRAVVSASHFRAAHPHRITRDQRERSLARQERVNRGQVHVDRRQTRVDRRQVHIDRRQMRVDRRPPQAQVRSRSSRQQKAVAQQRRQVRVDRHQIRNDRRQVQVDRRQVRNDHRQIQRRQSRPSPVAQGRQHGRGEGRQGHQQGRQSGHNGRNNGHGRPPGQGHGRG